MRNKKLVLFVIMLIFAYTSMTAQTAENKYSIGLNIVKSEYNGDYGNGIWNFNQFYPGWGLSFGMYYNPSIDVGLQGSYGSYGYVMDKANAFKINKFDMKLLGRFKFNNGNILEETSKYSPFLVAGIGFASYSPRIPGYPEEVTQGNDLIIPFGAGLKYQFSDNVALQYQYLYNFTNRDHHDENRLRNSPEKRAIYDSKEGNDAFGEHILSLVFTLPNAKDIDKDFISNSKEKVRNTFAGIKAKSKDRALKAEKDELSDNTGDVKNKSVEPVSPLKADKEELSDNTGDVKNKNVEPVSPIKEVEEEAKVRPIENDKVESNTVIQTTQYVVGSRKELIEEKIITPDGWFRPGRLLEGDFDKDYFVKIDAKTTKSISLYSPNAKILTTHPTSSYLLEKVNDSVTLQIIDTNKFWSISNYLVIEVY